MKFKQYSSSFLAFAILGALFPLVAFAQDGTGSSTFVNSLSLWVAVVVGVVASLLVLRNASKIGGGALGSVYYFFGAGMFLVVVGFLAVVVPPWAPMYVIMRVHDVLFIIGYAVMAIGAKKILTAAGVK